MTDTPKPTTAKQERLKLLEGAKLYIFRYADNVEDQRNNMGWGLEEVFKYLEKLEETLE